MEKKTVLRAVMKSIVQKSLVAMISSNVQTGNVLISRGVAVNINTFCPMFLEAKILDQIRFTMQIDGENDCSSDNSDEENCHANATNTVCKPNYFQCADGKSCIPATWQW